METTKKKRSSEGRTSGKKLKRSNDGLTAELDEFLAILNRLQAGIKRFQAKAAGDVAGKSVATDSGSLNMAFELEDFIQFHDGCRKTSTGDAVQKVTGSGIDLNADPTSDQTCD
ncbi:hypothetical protein R6Q59_006605 [Mikania micrantha]|uniref:Uncharacterized protein n=1 Tax=Mikania micrantha TaxID=192012 RepID=A0A5N6PSX8_9ASTR|nr:hypothetical protein E3N88_03933 [Mikania micrantha]